MQVRFGEHFCDFHLHRAPSPVPFPMLPVDRRCCAFFLSRRVVPAKITAQSSEDYLSPAHWRSLLSRTKAPTVSCPQNLYFSHSRLWIDRNAPPPCPLLNQEHFQQIDYGQNFPRGPPSNNHKQSLSPCTCHSGIVSPRWRIVHHGPLRPVQSSARLGYLIHLSTNIACNLIHPQPFTLSTSWLAVA
jgi:hypothetical protein